MRLALATYRSSPLHPGSLLTRLLARLVEADARYREFRKFEDLPEERLRDMGLTGSAKLMRTPALRGDWG